VLCLWVEYEISLRGEYGIRVFRPSLRIKCTSRVYYSFFWIDFADSVHGLILPMSLQV